MTKGREDPNPIDWVAIEMKYRTSGASVRTIATQYGVTEGAIRRRAKVEGWERDLREKVRVATESLLVRKEATRDVRTEREAVETEAEIQANVVMSHRSSLRRLAAIEEGLAGMLEKALAAQPEFEEMTAMLRKAMKDDPIALADTLRMVHKMSGRSQMVSDYKQLVDASDKRQLGERRAFSITDGDQGGGGFEDRLRALGEMSL